LIAVKIEWFVQLNSNRIHLIILVENFIWRNRIYRLTFTLQLLAYDTTATTCIRHYCNYLHTSLLQLFAYDTTATTCIRHCCNYLHTSLLQLLAYDTTATTCIRHYCNYLHTSLLQLFAYFTTATIWDTSLHMQQNITRHHLHTSLCVGT